MMDRAAVNSTSIKSIGHDPATQTLHVEFHNGKVYEYPGVSAESHAALVTAESIGKHFSAHIRPKYSAKPVIPMEPTHDDE
jgi:hypothetical protein